MTINVRFATPWMLIWNMDANSFEKQGNSAFDLHLSNDVKIERFGSNQTLCSFNNESHIFVITKLDRTRFAMAEMNG